MGAKRPLNGTSKVNTRTNRQTDGRTNRLIESIGPKGRCFESIEVLMILKKKSLFLADFALQNMVETTLPDGLETSGRRVYC